MTREGQLKGKRLGYMAPEQIAGDASRTTDVYAASVVLWETLTGRRLFAGDSDAQVLDQVLSGCGVPPSAFVPGLPEALDAVTLRGLSVDPALRYPTARDMARALEEAGPLMTASKIGRVGRVRGEGDARWAPEPSRHRGHRERRGGGGPLRVRGARRRIRRS